MSVKSWIKRSLLASFFLVSYESMAEESRFLTLSADQQAQLTSLFHFQSGQPKITDPAFLLSDSKKSLNSEFEHSIRAYTSTGQQQQDFLCRFPARSLWLSRFLNQKIPDFQHCNELYEYMQQVPVDEISLIYASENLLSPSSFMGHSFIKMKDKEDQRTHAVSYFTEVEGFNLPAIMFEALVTGKEGYFIVSPYEEAKRYYKDIEGRNVYEYSLAMSDFDRELIRLHLWELKDKKIDYYFHTNNCATLTLDILAIADPSLLKHSKEWLTPLDVVKYVDTSRLASTVSISPSLGWKIRAFGDGLDYSHKSALLEQLTKTDEQPLSLSAEHVNANALLEHEYRQALNDWLYFEKRIEKKQYERNRDEIANYGGDYAHFMLDLSDYKNPVKRAADSQIMVAGRFREDDANMLLSWLPASHLKLDDNRNAFSESSLQVLKSTVGIDKDHVYLDEVEIGRAHV